MLCCACDLNDFKNLSGETKDDLKIHSKGMCYYQESLFLSFYEILSIVCLYIKHWLGHVQELSPGKAISIVAIVVDPCYTVRQWVSPLYSFLEDGVCSHFVFRVAKACFPY